MLKSKLIESFRVESGTKVRLRDYDPGWIPREIALLGKDELKQKARSVLARNLDELSEAQARLYADDSYSVLVVFQAMDAAGKDGLIKHVMSGLNPQGCQVFSFKTPSDEELDHNFLWRYTKGLPERGRIGIFNRSYYEEVLIVRVHPEILARQKLPQTKKGRKLWEQRFDDINNFERHLTRNGTVILKFFLHLSKEEQRRRFLARIEDPAKHWKFSTADINERRHWDRYMEAYEEAISATSTERAPWYIIPADHKWIARVIVAEVLRQAIADLDIDYPKVPAEKKKALREAKRRLLNETK